MEEPFINLKKYLSVATQLGFIASRFVKECFQNPNLKKYEKKKNDPVTEADFKVQTLIINGLRHFFPNLRIVGQQTVNYQGQINVNYAQISTQNCPEDIQLDEKAPIQQFCVYIDPIDNTKGFIDGTINCVTVLIGLSRNKESYIGITALPFYEENNNMIYKPEILIGIAPLFKAYSLFQVNKWNLMNRPQKNIPIRIVARDTKKVSQQLQNSLKSCDAKLYYIGGAGKKIAQVAKGQMDILIYEGKCNHKWDTCASQSLILALGGFFTDQRGRRIQYDPNDPNTVNTHGNICTLYKQLHKNILKSYQTNSSL